MLEFRFIAGNNGYEISKNMRSDIFGNELGYQNVCDEHEEDSYHFVGYDKTQLISAARLTETGDKTFNIAYVCVRENYRRQYVGDLMVKALADKAVALGGTVLMARAPVSVCGFFEFEGFERYDAEFIEDNRIQVIMKKDLLKIQQCRGCGR